MSLGEVNHLTVCVAMVLAQLGRGAGITDDLPAWGHCAECSLYFKYTKISMISLKWKIILTWDHSHLIFFLIGIFQFTKAWVEMPEEEMCLLGENLHVSGPPPSQWCPPPAPSCLLSRGCLLKGAAGPLKACTERSFGWRFLSGCYILLPIKMNSQYVLCPDNHLVEAQ